MLKKISAISAIILTLSFFCTGMVAAKTLKMGAVTGAEANISKAAEHFIKLVDFLNNGF